MNALRWDEALVRCRAANAPCVLVTVLGTAGSTPREAGAKMVVTLEESYDSIGGGQLERLCIEAARRALAEDGEAQRVEHFPLGQAARQCCGGAVAVLMERIEPALTELALFGAGHVAHALLTILAELPFRVHWIDTRADLLDRPSSPRLVPIPTADPVAAVDALPAGVPALVLTHDHDLDLQLVRALLDRARRDEGTDPFVGLIGSQVKAERFRRRLEGDGIDTAGLHCPVGLTDVPGKAPMAVAVSIAAQLLQRFHPERETDPARQAGLGWATLRDLLATPDA